MCHEMLRANMLRINMLRNMLLNMLRNIMAILADQVLTGSDSFGSLLSSPGQVHWRARGASTGATAYAHRAFERFGPWRLRMYSR